MKLILVVIISLYGTFSFCQITDTIEVCFTKSAYLVFKDESVKFDCGSEDVLVRNSGNKLIVQAGVEAFEETNLFVECDGDIYMFIIQYKENADKFLYDYAQIGYVSLEKNGSGTTVKLIGDSIRSNDNLEVEITGQEKEYIQVSKEMIDTKDYVFNRGVSKYKIGVYLRDVVIHNDNMYLEFEVKNSSNIPYILDYYKFRVRSVKRRIKDESFQEIELNPIYQYLRPERFEGKTTYKYIVVLDKFVLTDGKKLVIEHWENNGMDMNIEGGRKINFDVFSKDILNVRMI